MPRNNNNPGPRPEPMTWLRALPVLALCVLFDALRLFFNLFWFFGPALAGVLCTIVGSSYLPGNAGTLVAGGVCSTAAVVAGVVAVKATTFFGVVMAMVVGLIGWLTIFLIQVMNNIGIFKESWAIIIRYVVSRLVSFVLGQIPLINALPSLTIINGYMYHRQIKNGGEALRKWEEETADARQREQQQQALQAQQARILQMQAANDAQYETQAANDEQYGDVPEEERKAA